jgi:lipoprotein-anchoring transpeptidase ErfK/SrfK
MAPRLIPSRIVTFSGQAEPESEGRLSVSGGRIRTALAYRDIPATRAIGAVALVGVAVLATSIGLVLSSGGGTAVAKGQPSATAPARQAAQLRPVSRPSARPVSRSAVPESTELATVLSTAPKYAVPGRVAAGAVPASWYQRPSVLPVIAAKPGWVEVRLAQRPDESTAWLPASDVRLSTTPYEIVVDLATTKLSLFDGGRLVFSAPAGVGSADDPTPTGHYFVAFDEPPPQPNPGYGPFIIVTSDHSHAISDWDGSGDAVIGIHGPLGEDGEIGTAGARISHGCIRLHDQALEELAKVPPGTPIDVVG